MNSPPRVDWAPSQLAICSDSNYRAPSFYGFLTRMMSLYGNTIILDLQGFTIFKPRTLARMPGKNDHFNTTATVTLFKDFQNL